MISVDRAQEIIHSVSISVEKLRIPLAESKGLALAESVRADRDFPPFDRVTMDGIAISFEEFDQGRTFFKIEKTRQAGAPVYSLKEKANCVEIMTGAIRPLGTDSIIRYEDVEISELKGERIAEVKIEPSLGQNIHKQGSDRPAGELLIKKGTLIGAAEIAIMATVGMAEVTCYKPPKVAIISTGDELVEVDQSPQLHQIRISNSYMINAALAELGIQADQFHLVDELEVLREKLQSILTSFDIVILSGGVSMGKADFVPVVLGELGVQQHFHRVKQRPGKPLWFGSSAEAVVFALPGNPVSSFASTIRYILPWIKNQLQMPLSPGIHAKLGAPINFKPSLRYFMQVEVRSEETGELYAFPIEGHGSGDHANLLNCNAFMEVPGENRTAFEKGEIFPVYLFKNI